jgi:alkylated DNA repair dioxygenase AlkB
MLFYVLLTLLLVRREGTGISVRSEKRGFTMVTTRRRAATTLSSSEATSSSNSSNSSKRQRKAATNEEAERLAQKLDSTPIYLTPDGASWYIVAKRWMATPSPEAFQAEWDLHPSSRRPLFVYGRQVHEKRWSQGWGVSFRYSGALIEARPLNESTVLRDLLEKANTLVEDVVVSNTDDETVYNGCLQNWYEPDDTIARHSDNEKELRREFPILSLSWGGTRRFLFLEKKTKTKVEVWLEDGDLLCMGGTCQATHHHEVPKRRVTMDPPTCNRINWTLRAFY